MSTKLAQYVHHLNTFHLLKTESVHRKAADSTSKKQLIKCYKAGASFPVFDNIFTTNILGMWGRRGSCRGCCYLVSQYHNTDVPTFLKLMIMIEISNILTYGQQGIPKKKKKKSKLGGLRIYFSGIPLEFLDLSLYPLPEKTIFHPSKFCKIA